MKKKSPQPFVSFAQNYEDVILWRALKHVKKGFYIDVGAAWPEDHSVTKAFYDRGWRGINIEPNPIHFLSLKKKRERDINLQIAVGECEGELQMNFIGNTGLSTLDKDIATQHKIDGWGVESSTVIVKPLSRIISLNIPAGQDIHFLKVDIEGFEKQALQSHDWMSCRPWVVLVESILPTSYKDSFADWEPILLNANYQFVYADGLNRFYVAKEHASLIDAFKFPPNIFDSFIQVEVIQAKAKAEQAQQQTIEAKAKAEQAQQQTIKAKAKAEQAQQQTIKAKAKAEQAQAALDTHVAQLQAVYNSSSWRITAPLRWPVHQLRLLRTRGFKQRTKALLEKLLSKIFLFIFLRPKLKNFVIQVIFKLGVSQRLKIWLSDLSISAGLVNEKIHKSPLVFKNLSPRAQAIYKDLIKSIKSQSRL